MKRNNFFIFCFINIFISHALVAMDKPAQPVPTQRNTPIPDRNIEIASTAIDHKYNTFSDHFSSDTDDKCFDIIKIATTHCGQNIDARAINKLYNKNSLFQRAIGHFYRLAQKNFDNVTCDNLAVLENPQLIQPVSQLNGLPPTIKEYVMNCAYRSIGYKHTITFSEKNDDINNVDFYTHNHLVATASCNGKFRLWNLATQKMACELTEPSVNGYVKFNNQGSLLATATNPQKGTVVQIWDVSAQKLMHTIQQKSPITYLDFLRNTSENILVTFGAETSLYMLKENTEPIYLGSSTMLRKPAAEGYRDYHLSGNYCEPIRTRGLACYVMKQCRDLYLCQKALENTYQRDSLDKVTKTILYKRLTSHDKDMIDEQLKQKMKLLQ